MDCIKHTHTHTHAVTKSYALSEKHHCVYLLFEEDFFCKSHITEAHTHITNVHARTHTHREKKREREREKAVL